MFVQRMKNDPKFAAKMIELQKNISQADDPINAPQTYFNQNDSLQLDTRDTTDNSDKIVDGTHTTSELADLAAEGINHRQQQEDLDLHPRSAEINVIAQSLAFTKANLSDAPSIAKLINSSYNRFEASDSFRESFRVAGSKVLDESMVNQMISEGGGCEVLIAEVPLGRGVVEDGALIAVCVYSVGDNAASGQAGDKKDKPGAVRILAVHHEFLGLCIGNRMLSKVEKSMVSKDSCDFSVACVVSTRVALQQWIERRGYSKTSEVVFPVDAVPFEIRKEKLEGLKIFVYEKRFRGNGGGEVVEGALERDEKAAKLTIFDQADAAMRGIDVRDVEITDK
ncbi:hypothetical protein ScalyP_jg9180 [Parmales sp. scaly parma]|nr:hypothetical protein ScalyP_jg9180 [Parmales sp. scaly parma]